MRHPEIGVATTQQVGGQQLVTEGQALLDPSLQKFEAVLPEAQGHFLTKLDPSLPPSRAEVKGERAIAWGSGRSNLSCGGLVKACEDCQGQRTWGFQSQMQG